MSFDLFPKSKKQKNRDVVEHRKAKGDVSEDIVEFREQARGSSVRRQNQRIGGYDLGVRRPGALLQPSGKELHIEVKSNPKNRETRNQLRQKATDPQYRRETVGIDSMPGANAYIEARKWANRYKKPRN